MIGPPLADDWEKLFREFGLIVVALGIKFFSIPTGVSIPTLREDLRSWTDLEGTPAVPIEKSGSATQRSPNELSAIYIETYKNILKRLDKIESN